MSDDTTYKGPWTYSKSEQYLQHTRPNNISQQLKIKERNEAKANEYKNLVYETKDELNKRIDLLQYEIQNIKNLLVNLNVKE